MKKDNKKAYELAGVVDEYLKLQHLFEPEKAIIERFINQLPTTKMLDIGIGSGRTTAFFAPLVYEYTGIDYGENFINVCKKRFSEHPGYRFLNCDVTDMGVFNDNYFDLAFFSYNGLDSVSHSQRISAYKEIKRVLKQSGCFIFSAHNLNSINKLYKIKDGASFIGTIKSIAKTLILIALNGFPKRFATLPHSHIVDGTHRFKLSLYYIRPHEQVKQLTEAGFTNIEVISMHTGEVIPENEYQQNSDPWVYYLCRA